MAVLSRTRLVRTSWMMLVISALYVIVTTAWIATEVRSILPVMEILTIGSAVLVLQFMVEIHRGTAQAQRSRTLVALLLTAGMATVTISNHFLYLTVLPQLYGDAGLPPWLLLDGWPSLTKGLECVAWALLLGLALLFAATPATGLGAQISWTLRASGIACLAGLVGPAIGDMSVYLLSTAGYSVGFVLLSIEILVRFRGERRRRLDVVEPENLPLSPDPVTTPRNAPEVPVA